MIRAYGVRKVFRSGDEEVEALRGVSLEIPDGGLRLHRGALGIGQDDAPAPPGALDLRPRARSRLTARS